MELVPIDFFKPLELVFPNHLKNLTKMIMSAGVVESPIIADKETGIVLDGSHRYVFFLAEGFKEAPAKLVDYRDENIRVGTHLMHRHIVEGATGISKASVIERGLSGNLYQPRTTRHFFPFRKNTFADVPLSSLKSGDPTDVSRLIADVGVVDEIEHNRGYVKEIEKEIGEVIKYLYEVQQTKSYLEAQISAMEPQV